MPTSNSRISVVLRTAIAAAGALTVTALAVTVPAAADAHNNGPDFSRHTLTQQVSLTGNGPADQSLSSVVYQPEGGHARGIQVMVPGATYDHSYFDLKTSQGWVSQARKAAEDGWISVAVDRIGTGKSSHPAAGDVNNTVDAATIHQLIAKLRSTYKGLPVSLVGHSQGSSVALQEAATYKDVNAVVITGLLHHAGAAEGVFGTLVHPAAEDPAFANHPAPTGYITTRPGLRQYFYWPFNADLATVQADDATKQTITPGESGDFMTEQNQGRFAKGVNVPVLSVVGEHDTFYFDPADRDKTVAAEPAAYPASPHVDVKVVPNAGHDLALQRNSDDTTNYIDTWLSREA
ncbi:alpha/beta hydrolase [Streptomyces sp. GS7]|uniref:alpha/beta hydrolase n=1 Tax=Streptomyces sp. GS7 TaxID=2692234 RepID=UPI00131726FB|nr:alpha/beta hydrolase [Streptomyces sp. GS7]QHC23216.1 alpha/beta fold hydrolase [Streptomyces sp. GS7]